MDGWNTTFILGRPIFRGFVSFREGKFSVPKKPEICHPSDFQANHGLEGRCRFWGGCLNLHSERNHSKHVGDFSIYVYI